MKSAETNGKGDRMQTLQFANMDFSACDTARKMAKATGCTFAVASACVSARGGDFARACEAVRELRRERRAQ